MELSKSEKLLQLFKFKLSSIVYLEILDEKHEKQSGSFGLAARVTLLNKSPRLLALKQHPNISYTLLNLQNARATFLYSSTA
jgi:hypothetical protein